MNEKIISQQSVVPPQNNMRERKQKKKRHIGTYIALIVAVLLVCFPVYIALITSLMTKSEANYVEFHWIPQQGISFRGYIEAFTKDYNGPNVLKSLWNTLWMYIPPTLIGLYFSAMAAFAFAKLNFMFKNAIFVILMLAIMIPSNMGTIAKLLIYDNMRWLGTPLPIMIPRMFGAITMIFFLRQFYFGMPKDIIDAARIDGLGFFSVFNRIMLPLSVSPLLVQFIFAFIAAYNDYNDPLYFLTSNVNLRTIQLTLAFLVDPYQQDWPLRMAACIASAIPMFILYLFTQDIMLKGLDISASIKG